MSNAKTVIEQTSSLTDVAKMQKISDKPGIFFFVYTLQYAFHGCLLSLPGTIYVELQTDLNTSTKTISWIFSAMAIASAMSAFISGYIMNKFQDTHKYLSFMSFLQVIALVAIPFNKSIAIMFILFIFIGLGYSAVDTCTPLFIFRVFPMKGQRIFFITQTVLSVTSMLMPLFIEISINKTGHYHIPLLTLAGFGAISVVVCICLPTPVHDKLRTIKRKISKMHKFDPNKSLSDAEEDIELEKVSREASFRLADNKTYKIQQYIIISILFFLMFLDSCFFYGTTAFITTYCVDYLNVNESVGRYLISAFYTGYISYRFLNILIDKVCGIKISHMYAVCFSFIIRLISTGILWIMFGDNGKQIIILFVVFGLNGFANSPVFPSVYQWSESVMSMNGFVSCMLIASYQAGFAVIAPILGSLIETYTAKLLPFVLLIPLGIGFVITVVNVVLYKICYKKHEKEAFNIENMKKNMKSNL